MRGVFRYTGEEYNIQIANLIDLFPVTVLLELDLTGLLD